MTISARRVLTGVAIAVASLLLTLVVAPAAEAAIPGYTFFVRPGDFVDPTGADGDATMRVQSDGVHIHVGDPGAIVAGSFNVPGGLPLYDFNQYGHHVVYAWSGSTEQPAIHYDIDLDGDGKPDVELVGEHQYGDDLWLNPDPFPDAALSRAALQAAAPCTNGEPHRRLQDGCGTAYGNAYHGTIYDWKTGFADRGYAGGSVVRGGFVATGAVIDGVLGSLDIGIDSFHLTTNPRVAATLTGTANPTRTTVGSTVTIGGTVDDTYNYPHVVLQEKDGADGSWYNVAERTFTTGNHYGFDVTVQSAGVIRFRAEVPRSSYNTQTFTKPILVRVR